MPAVNVGGTFPGPHVGIMDWAFGEYRIQLRSQPVVGSTGVSVRESAVAAGTDKVSIATFNVENLAGNEPDAKYNTLAGMIVNNLAAPDIVSLEEIQDNNGATNDSVVDANVTLDRLIAAISAARSSTVREATRRHPSQSSPARTAPNSPRARDASRRAIRPGTRAGSRSRPSSPTTDTSCS